MFSNPLSWMICIGLAYQESQVCSKWVMWLLDFSTIHAISTKLVVVSINVRTKNSTIPCGVDSGHGSIISTATSSQQTSAISWSGRNQWPGPEGLACWHSSHVNYSICMHRFGWWYWACSRVHMHQGPGCSSMVWNQWSVCWIMELVRANFYCVYHLHQVPHKR